MVARPHLPVRSDSAVERLDEVRTDFVVEGVERVEGEAVDQSAEAPHDLGTDVAGITDHGNGVQCPPGVLVTDRAEIHRRSGRRYPMSRPTSMRPRSKARPN